jgi:hypothetical protein
LYFCGSHAKPTKPPFQATEHAMFKLKQNEICQYARSNFAGPRSLQFPLPEELILKILSGYENSIEMYMIFTKSQKEKDHLDSTEDYRMEFQETLEGSSLVFGCLFSRTARWNNQQPVKSGNTFHATQPFLFELCDTNCFLDSKGSTANWARQATDRGLAGTGRSEGPGATSSPRSKAGCTA